MKLFKNKILSLLLIVQIVLVKWLANYPELIEKYYSNGIYPYISTFLRMLFGWLPFSVGDILYLIIIILVIRGVIKFIKNKSKKWSSALFNITAKLSIGYFIFHFFWGFNYYRLPVQDSMNMTIPKYNVDELSLLTEKLLVKTQELHFKITKNDSLPVTIQLDKNLLFKNASNSYVLLSEKYPQFNYSNKKVKKSLFSLPLTFMGFSGYLNPFTNEAQVNYKVPKYKLPAIATHEIAHQLGYANESEANFIGYLAAKYSEDLLLNYSGNIMALRYCLSEIYRSDKELYKEFVSRIPKGVKLNLQQSRDFWNSYDNPFEPLFKTFYDLFLKSNSQKQGIKSYGKMVGLLLAYETEK